jgi:hypothetical protein
MQLLEPEILQRKIEELERQVNLMKKIIQQHVDLFSDVVKILERLNNK